MNQFVRAIWRRPNKHPPNTFTLLYCALLHVLKQRNQLVMAPPPQPQPVAAALHSPAPSENVKFDQLSNQIKQLQKQLQQVSSNSAMAAYDRPPPQPRPPQSDAWQSQTNRQMQQLQNQVAHLENELCRYQDPRHLDFGLDEIHEV